MYTTTVPIIIDTHFEKEHLLRELRRCKVDRIAFALNREVEYRFTSPENLARLKEMTEFFRKEGFEIAFWIGETLGHDQVTSYPEGCEEPYRRMKLPCKGTVASFCPTDETFTADLCRWVRTVAELKPDLIMLDDDYRMNGGCCCAAHVDWMNRELGETLTAEEWVKNAFSGGKNRYRDVWMKVQGETLSSLARALREAVDSVDPSLRMGLCCSNYLWDGDGAEAERLVRILAGKNKPFIRTFGAPYHSYTNGKDTLGTSLELERWETAQCKQWDVEQVTEGDTYPRPRFFCPASYLECFDQVLRADGGSNGILKYALDYSSDVDYEHGYCDAWEENLALYDEISALFEGKTAVGVLPYLVQHTLREADFGAGIQDHKRIRNLAAGNYSSAAALAVMNNLPTAYEGDGARILFGEHARHCPEEDLNVGCILDYPAAKILQQRGIDVGIVSEGGADGFASTYLGGCEQYFREEGEYVRTSGRHRPESVVYARGAEVLTEFVSGSARIPGWVRYENAKGQRFLIFPFDTRDMMNRDVGGAGYLNGYSLQRMLISQIAWLNRTPLDAYAEGNHPYLYTLVKKNEGAMSVGVWNLFSDKIRDLRIHVNTTHKKIRFVNCEGRLEGDTVTLSSVLYPYEFAGFELYE